MSDNESKAPAPEPTQSIVDSPSAAPQPSDSAPPPTASRPSTNDSSSSSSSLSSSSSSSSPPPLPPIQLRDYTNQPVKRPTIQPVYAPNSTVPQFIRTITLLVFVIGGISSTLITLIYKNYLYPRLVLALQARTKLNQSHLTSYTNLLDRIKSFKSSKTRALLSGPSTAESNPEKDTEEKKGTLITEEIQTDVSGLKKENERSSEKKEKDESIPTTEEAEPTSPAPKILEPLTQSLTALSTLLKTSTTPASTSSTHITPTTKARSAAAESAALAAVSRLNPEHTLLGSLGSLNTFLENETYELISQSYRTNFTTSSTTASGTGSGTSGGGAKKVFGESVAGLKNEIRAVKGLLLNRRNFAISSTAISR